MKSMTSRGDSIGYFASNSGSNSEILNIARQPLSAACSHRNRDGSRSQQENSRRQRRLRLQNADAQHKGDERRQWHG